MVSVSFSHSPYPHSRSEMESRLAETSSREEALKSQLEKLETERNEIENDLKSHTQTSAEKIAELEQQLKEASDKVGVLQLELDSTRLEVGVAKEDARTFSEQVTAAQEMYERELLQHGKSMESLHRVKEEVREGLILDGERGVNIGW